MIENNLPPNAISVLDENWIFFKKWLQELIDKRGVDSNLTLGQLAEMTCFIEKCSEKTDEIILKAVMGE